MTYLTHPLKKIVILLTLVQFISGTQAHAGILAIKTLDSGLALYGLMFSSIGGAAGLANYGIEKCTQTPDEREWESKTYQYAYTASNWIKRVFCGIGLILLGEESRDAQLTQLLPILSQSEQADFLSRYNGLKAEDFESYHQKVHELNAMLGGLFHPERLPGSLSEFFQTQPQGIQKTVAVICDDICHQARQQRRSE